MGGPSVFAQWSVMKEVKQNGISVVLGGQGGDENSMRLREIPLLLPVATFALRRSAIYP